MLFHTISDHPTLDFSDKKDLVPFTFNGKTFQGIPGIPIIMSLKANGINKLKEGAKHHTPYGPFCMQGRCCSCAMTVNNMPNVMTCTTPLEEGMNIRFTDINNDINVFKRLPSKNFNFSPSRISQKHPKCDLAIIGAGPAGMEAAITAFNAGVTSIVLFDDKEFIGGQLTLQTHSFFGNQELGASVRGYEIANMMRKEIENSTVDVRLDSTVVGLYPNNMLGFRDENKLNFLEAKKIICATGASEKFLSFPGNCLPGVMGAGGAQTFMNIYGILPGQNVLIVGGGNIGVILAYQLVQSGINVKAVIEAASEMGAYEVHTLKLQALGVPVYTRHTIKQAHGSNQVEGASIVEIDNNWAPIANSEKYLEVDTICLAVGLNPLNELLWQAGVEFTFSKELGEIPVFNRFLQTTNPDIFVAGDCATIGEASIARLEGRIAALKAANDLGLTAKDFDKKVDSAQGLLDSIQSGSFGERLGNGKKKITKTDSKNSFKISKFSQSISPSDFSSKERKIILNCSQDIPCNPCESSCKFKAISIGKELNQPPDVDLSKCTGCGLCLPACPGRAIRLLQYNYDETHSALTIPFEFYPVPKKDDKVTVLNQDGEKLTTAIVLQVKPAKNKLLCGTITIKVEKEHAFDSTMIDILPQSEKQECNCQNNLYDDTKLNNDSFVCRCEEVKHSEIIDLIKQGHTNLNDIKRLKRVGMGQCRGLSCTSVVESIIKKELNISTEHTLQVKKNRRTIFRPPIKRITLGEAAKLKFTPEEINNFIEVEKTRTIPQDIVNSFTRENFSVSKTLSSKYVIIGGGVSGVFTAWWLAKLGATDITVVEKSFLTSGQTGACLGGIRTGFNSLAKVKRATKSLEVFKNSHQLIGEDVGWHQGGYVYLSFDKKQDNLFKQTENTWKKENINFTLTNDKSSFSSFVPGVNSKNITSLVHFPDSGGANPFRTVYKFAEDAKKMGVTFLVDHEVKDIQCKTTPSGSTVTGVTVKNTNWELNNEPQYIQINTENVINAGGTSAVSISKMVDIDLSSQIWIERHGAFITEKMPLWLDPMIVSYHPTLSGYWQQKRMEENVKEGEIVACYSPENPIKGHNTHSFIYFLSRMAQAILQCQPGMSNVGIIRNFAEHYVGRQSGIPIIGKTPVKGFWLNIAKKGHGFMCGPGDAYALAKTIIENQTHEWIEECTIDQNESPHETMK